jgi:hypothetical protein
LILIASISSTSSTMPSFQFLAGRSPVPMVRDQEWRRGGSWSVHFYSFTGDFESICTAAQAELSALGYTEMPRNSDDFFATHEYRLRQNAPDGAIAVRIMARAKLIVASTPKNSQYSSPDRYTYRPQDGWISVQVAQWRGGGLWQNLKARASRLLWRMSLLRPKGATSGLPPSKAAGRAEQAAIPLTPGSAGEHQKALPFRACLE